MGAVKGRGGVVCAGGGGGGGGRGGRGTRAHLFGDGEVKS
jgi:hypothetical protein